MRRGHLPPSRDSFGAYVSRRSSALPPPSTVAEVVACYEASSPTMLRYHEQPRAVPVPGRSGEGRRLALSGELHTLGYYSAMVCLGKPGQPYDLIVDTGSSITAVRPPRPPRPPHAPLPPHPPRTLTAVTLAAPATRTRHGGSHPPPTLAQGLSSVHHPPPGRCRVPAAGSAARTCVALRAASTLAPRPRRRRSSVL